MNMSEKEAQHIRLDDWREHNMRSAIDKNTITKSVNSTKWLQKKNENREKWSRFSDSFFLLLVVALCNLLRYITHFNGVSLAFCPHFMNHFICKCSKNCINFLCTLIIGWIRTWNRQEYVNVYASVSQMQQQKQYIVPSL